MLSTTQTIGICLFELPDKDQAVIQRVITFGASQGKNYSLQSEAADAQIIVTLDNIALPPCSAVTVRIGETNEMDSDLLLQRPLLVTRVMRAIDDAAQLHHSRPTPEVVTTDEAKQEEETAQVKSPPAEESAQNNPVTNEPPQKEKTKEQDSITITDQESEIVDPAAEASMEENDADDPVTTDAGYEAEAVEQIEITDSPPIQAPEENPDYKHFALVVDDSAAIRKQLEIELRNANIKADFAETGEEALEKSAQQTYDLVFLDIIMPGIDGYEVCRQMRSRKSMKKTPIIMLSGKTSPLDEVQGVIAGASTYLTKPVKHEQFQQTLKRVSKWLTEFAR